MSWDISLLDPVTKNTLELPIKHVMTGGTFLADYDKNTGMFSPKPTTEAWLNITYNYSPYYYAATEGDDRFGPDGGLRGINEKTGLQSIAMLNDMITRITNKYYINGEWITTSHKKTRFIENTTGKELDLVVDIIHKHIPSSEYHSEEYTVDINEGSSDDYWEATAANAIKPLRQLLVMAELRPDGIWEIS